MATAAELAQEIERRLAEAFVPARLDVRDESEEHRGHAGWREGGGTHWRVVLRSERLAGLTRLERHRAVHAALGPELLARIHALALDLG